MQGKWNPTFASQHGILGCVWDWKLEDRGFNADAISNFPQGTTPLEPSLCINEGVGVWPDPVKQTNEKIPWFFINNPKFKTKI